MEQTFLLKRNLRALNLIGLWPTNTKFAFIYNIYAKCVYLWFITFTMTQFIEMKYVYKDFKELTSNAGVSLLYTVGIAKVYYVMFKKTHLHQLVNKINETEAKIMKGNDRNAKLIIHKYIEQNWSVTKKFWLLTFWTIVGFFTSPSLEAMLITPQEIIFANGTSTGRFKKPLIFSSWFPFDKYASIKHYLFAYGLQTISGTIGASYLAIWDTFIVALMIFATGQFRILHYYLKNIYDTGTNNFFRKDKLNRKFIRCIKHHNMIIKYIKDLDNFISPVMFLDFIVCSLMLCAIGLQATLEGPTIRLAFTIEYLIAMLIQLFMFYWHANEIMLESLEVCNAAWDSQWYDCTIEVQKGLVLVMLRAQKPCVLSAGRFYSMSLQTFILILRVSYSYLALLRQVYARPLETK